MKIDDIDVNKILACKGKPYGKRNSFKYYIGYNDEDVIRPLCLKLPQMIGYVKCFESNKTILSDKISDEMLLKKYTLIWKKVKTLLNTKFDNEPVSSNNDEYIKTKIKIYDGNVNTIFQVKKVPNKNASCEKVFLINNARFCC